MTTYLVTRHPGAIEWAKRQGIDVDQHISHIDPEMIESGDVVIGTLPVNLAAAVCARGGHYWHLSLSLPPEIRGQELNADELDQYGARLDEYSIHSK